MIFSGSWCEKRDLKPYGKTTRPSNVRVYQFRHFRVNSQYYTHEKLFCQGVFAKIFYFFQRSAARAKKNEKSREKSRFLSFFLLYALYKVL